MTRSRGLANFCRYLGMRAGGWLRRAPGTGGRVVEGTGLENRHTGNGIVSSNLTLSVRDAGVRSRAGGDPLCDSLVPLVVWELGIGGRVV